MKGGGASHPSMTWQIRGLLRAVSPRDPFKIASGAKKGTQSQSVLTPTATPNSKKALPNSNREDEPGFPDREPGPRNSPPGQS